MKRRNSALLQELTLQQILNTKHLPAVGRRNPKPFQNSNNQCSEKVFPVLNLTVCRKSPFQPYEVIPAEAGIQSFQAFLDSRFRGSDSDLGFFPNLLEFWSLEFVQSLGFRI